MVIKKSDQNNRCLGMKRRDFLKFGSTSAASLLASSYLAAWPKSFAHLKSISVKDEFFELEEATLVDLQAAMRSGEITSERLVALYLERIDKLDKEGPALNSILEINPEALAIAKAMDEERKQKGARGSLHGIPVVIKANIDTADKMTTTAGSLALAGSRPPRDAFIVEKLRKAGAVILGKANLSEWANFRSTRSSSGWSSQGGQTKNPYALNRNPGGSSSGSAVAVAANLCAISIGTETDGSIMCPASLCGVVGIKPTVGLVSRYGIIPIAHSQDTAGPIARTVADAAILLGVLTGIDQRDLATSESKGKAQADYTAFLDKDGLKGARIGVARKSFGFHEEVDRLMEEALSVMKSQGAVIVDPADIQPEERYGDEEFEVLLYEFKSDLNAYLETLGSNSPLRSLKDIIAFNEEHRKEVMPYFGQEIFLMAEKKGPLTSEEYLKALEQCRRLSRTEGIDKALKEHGLDAVVAPTDGPAWVTDLVTGDHYLGGSSQAAAVAGYPSITVPAGDVFGLPVGISFIGGAHQEGKLIKLAYAYEQASRHRHAPSFLPTV
jgi:amidase